MTTEQIISPEIGQQQKKELYEGMEQSYLLEQDREISRQKLLSNPDDRDAITEFMRKTDAVIAQLKAEKALIERESKENKNLWVKANTYNIDQTRKIEYLEGQLRSVQNGQLQGIGAEQILNQKNFEQHTSRETFKKKLSNSFRDNLDKGKLM